MKLTTQSKQRLAALLPAPLRQRLAIAMFTDVITALSATPGIAGIAVVTIDPEVIEIARTHSARIITNGAQAGHTGAVTAAAELLDAEGHAAMLALPGDIPLVSPAEITTILRAHAAAPCVSIVPSHDHLGSNAVMLSPPRVMPLRFGDNSYYPHLATAQARAIPTHCHILPGIALDIDTPADLRTLHVLRRTTHTHRLLDEIMPEALSRPPS